MFDFLFQKRKKEQKPQVNDTKPEDRLPPATNEEVFFNPLGRFASVVKTGVYKMNRNEYLRSEEEVRKHLANIAVVAFVGSSGTGKSTKAISVAKENNINYIIDDGILIHGSTIIAGSSAKRARTKIESVKSAIFADETRAHNMRRALLEELPTTLMILGTSRDMIDRICKNLWLSKPSMLIRIEDISTEEEVRLAQETRMSQGKHTIPVPTMEIKHEFSGSLVDPWNKLRKRFDRNESNAPPETERTVVRPTFSTLGNYSISDEAMAQMVEISLKQVPGVAAMKAFRPIKEAQGASFEIAIALYYGYPAQEVMQETQRQVSKDISQQTSIYILKVDVKAVQLLRPQEKSEAKTV